MRVGKFEVDHMALLLVFVPVSIVLEWVHADPVWIFAASALAIVPLAGQMGKATEYLAEHLGSGLGGLLNASFGNAAELIIGFFALRAGLIDVVKASITGSIIGNILLVLGASVVVGGLKHETQYFNRTAAGLGVTLAALSAIALVVPAIFHLVVQGHPEPHERELSLEIALVLFVTYILSLVFTLRTHRHLYVGESSEETDEALGVGAWSMRKSLLILLVATALVAWMSELLVGAVEHAAHDLGMTNVFIGVILVAIVGNAAEHSTAVMMAAKNHMDLAMNIAIGSSIQIALFVAPLLVFAGHVMGQPMDLVFSTFEVVAVAIAVAAVVLIAMDGESNWMEGVNLLAVYVILAIAFYFLP
ncbi:MULTISPECIES: calcium/proton exchanger [Methylococcus]|jgi:Ca2+:H+ antiporter|uniref:Ca(2+)/H(+) antiporter n=2 Tax=Methylococcus capsulatus TaxID=414 RepID=Q60CG4_METCA|nr:calcium/proton exchanger [Methylococcus capsulatus]AAU90627.1 calcium/proton exchanger [Methylococcus capsulatus str. Bath]QXP86365.1 calcium/proton exchanger [Methylococcus capsulatus]QXP89419.1 calcium/proton exchanger [Methylococcus capsulatus]QXP93966.1 calcium/proton exchanger [Methylococcus capsulatus]UQN11305.1 calcium/proton exchanger [Methylococcus capsulatus]